ncbi:hypothetical protein SK3146_05648 [Paenibacillus konkukensis]|uniref:Uncharacterized protein n=1 Tax=Paenibacillus konkukensis TaxID=2020716 RepID=A0ABY4RVH1_9BACL|nr:hypothetical protein [Paenibacillus konkukensis]UQZ86355.1 hypothetical protein SK3146_05648 [Paenibacillus konkukensis]
MNMLKNTVKKAGVFAAAAALIAGGGATMYILLSGETFAQTGVQVVQQPIKDVQPDTKAAVTEEKAEYTVIDQSAAYTADKLKEALVAKGAPTAQLESRAAELQSTYVPGDKDITAEQAAAYGAGLLKKVFDADLAGYTARAGFLKGAVPGTDTWSLTFDPAGSSGEAAAEASGAKSYSVYLNSVNGKIINASSSYDRNAVKNAELNDSAWKEKAKQAVTALLPQNVTITGVKITAADGVDKIGVPVLCELSDGSAYMAGLAGDNKEIVNLYYFQTGYDGSLDRTINKQKQM